MSDVYGLQSFVLEEANVRGHIVRLQDTFNTIRKQRAYPPRIERFLGEAIAACLMLAGTIKFEGELSLQFQSDARFPLLIVQCDHMLNIRAYAQYKEALQDADYEAAFLQGRMALTLQQYQHTEAYQSIVPIESLDLSQNLMVYFTRSEQIPTFVKLVVGEDRVAGILIQLLPGENSTERDYFWEYAVHIAATITAEELLGLDNAHILHRLYHETTVMLFDARHTRFRCRCSKEKMRRVITLLGEDDAKALLEERGQIDVSCDFCNHHYQFDTIDITMLFHKH